MPSDNSLSKSKKRIDQEAAEWFVKRDHGLSDAEERDYQAWLKADPRHSIYMQRHEQIWSRFEPLVAFEEVGSYETELAERNESVSSPWFASAIRFVSSVAAVLAVGLILWGSMKLVSKNETVEFESRYVVNAYENRILADGSILELNEGARVKVRFTNTSRRVWLHDGEAHFHVAKDVDRPFIVFAGGTEVRAVGTAFNVRRNTGMVQVVVTEGRIRLTQSSLPQDSDNEESKPFSQEMDAGQVSTLQVGESVEKPFIETYTYDELLELLSWKPATLEFTAAPLGDVVMAFNKRNDIQIILADDELETMPIEATFRSDNVLAFTRLLEMTFELQAERRSQNEIILSLPH